MVRNTGIKGLENAVNITEIWGKYRMKFRLWSSSPSAPARKHSVIDRLLSVFCVYRSFWFWWFGNDEAHPGFGVRIVRFLGEAMLGTPVRHRGVCVDFPGIIR